MMPDRRTGAEEIDRCWKFGLLERTPSRTALAGLAVRGHRNEQTDAGPGSSAFPEADFRPQ
jgi:hypothetical protein